MSRGLGRVFRPIARGRPTAVWWLDYGVRGARHRESSGTTRKTEARRVLRERIRNREAAKLVGRPDRVVLAQYAKGDDGTTKLVGGLRAVAEKQYDIDERRSKDRVVQYWDHLERFFGAGTRVLDITGVRLDDYAAARLAAGAARQTVNNELSALRRGFPLAIDKGLLAGAPAFRLPRVANARSGFFGDGDFAALLLELPAGVRDLVQFLCATGWRRDEGRLLRWSSVDRKGGIIRLEEARSKSGEPRVFPFGLAPSLKALLNRRWGVRNGLYVFHRDGQPLGIGAVPRRGEGRRSARGSKGCWCMTCGARLRATSGAPARRRVGGRDHEALRVEDAFDVRPLQHHRRGGSRRRGGEAVWERQTNGKHEAFPARAEFCNFQPQQFLGP